MTDQPDGGIGEEVDDDDPSRFAEIYVSTHVSVQVDGEWLPAQLAVSRIGKSLRVLTAWNPGDHRPTDDENDRANSQLLADLEQVDPNVLPALGADPSSNHFEDSWAASEITDDQAIALGQKYGQVAIFRLDFESQTVLSCDSTWQRTRRYDNS
jgi:hypothetical protein